MEKEYTPSKEFTPYEESLALRELGFNEPCVGHYTKLTAEQNEGFAINWLSVAEVCIEDEEYRYGRLKNYNTDLYKQEGTISAPLYQQAFRWFRQKHELHPEFVVQIGFKHWNVHILPSGKWLDKPTPTGFESYKEAELACLRELIEIVKTKNHEIPH